MPTPVRRALTLNPHPLFLLIRLHIISDLLQAPIGIGGQASLSLKTQKIVGSMPCPNECHITCGYKPTLDKLMAWADQVQKSPTVAL